MTPEGKASDKIHLRASEWGCRLFRNNSGVLMDARGVPVRFGLGNISKKINKKLKSSDLIGYIPVTVTPEMVGKKVAVFTAVEAKPEGTVIKEVWPEHVREHGQQNFINLINNAGGLAGFATCSDDIDALLDAFVKRLQE